MHENARTLATARTVRKVLPLSLPYIKRPVYPIERRVPWSCEESVLNDGFSVSHPRRHHSTFSGERRTAKRYGLQLALAYKAETTDGGQCIGQGATCDISNRALRFLGGTKLPEGSRVEISLRWPAEQEQLRGVSLTIRGRVLRCEPRGIVILIGRYSFAPALV